MYSSAVVHNNRSSRVLCGALQRSRERDLGQPWRGSLGVGLDEHWHLPENT